MKTRHLWGFVFVGILGALLHFVYDWTGSNPVAALFSAVNESTWEHMKLLFYPWILWSLIRSRDKDFHSPWPNLIGLLIGLLTIPVLYYTYTGILGHSADWFNIAIFFLAVGAAFATEAYLQRKSFGCSLPHWPALIILLVLAVLFTVFTFQPPRLPLFQDPRTGSFGR